MDWKAVFKTFMQIIFIIGVLWLCTRHPTGFVIIASILTGGLTIFCLYQLNKTVK